MWQPLQILAGLLAVAAGVLIVRGRRRPPRQGAVFVLLRVLRRVAGAVILLIGLGVTLEGTPAINVRMCLELDDRGAPDWCFGGDGSESDDDALDGPLLDSSPERDAVAEEN